MTEATLRQQAQAHFAKNEYEEAERLYTRLLEEQTEDELWKVWTNRSLCWMRLEAYGQAFEDAKKAIELNDKWVKGYWYRGKANLCMTNWTAALKDFNIVVKMAPGNAEIKKERDALDKLVKKLAFEHAMAYDEPKTLLDTISYEDMLVGADYKGPRLDEERVTLPFVDELIEAFRRQEKLHEKYVYKILALSRAQFKEMPPLVDISIPKDGNITVCGDVHGQYYDVMNIFKLNGKPSETNAYLFNGDFVDRGSFSIEIIILFLAYKLLYPETFHLSRGNHEADDMNEMYGFTGEVTHKYNSKMFKAFSEVFCGIPLVNIIENKIMVVHGGLSSQDGVKLDDIRKINRWVQPASRSLMSDLMWSDPQDQMGRSPSMRGQVGCRFGPDITKQFLEDNGLDLLIRSHEVKHEGYEIAHDGKCITVFSAPKYCDFNTNKGAFIKFTPELKRTIIQFEAVPHPPVAAMAYAPKSMHM